MAVDISIDSFPASDFGVLEGSVSFIGSDALPPNSSSEIRTFNFPVTIDLSDQFLNLKDGNSLPLQTGMSLTANIKLRKVSYLRLLLSTGAVLHADKRSKVIKDISPYLLNYYGSTEGGGITVLKWDDPVNKSQSVGRLVYGTNLEIVDEEDRVLPANKLGRIRYCGPSVANNFFLNDKAGEAEFKNGWFYPGDLGTLDEDGYLYLKGRSKDIILRGGVNIYPKEIEEVLLEHPKVIDVSVLGWPSSLKGEEIAAFVVSGESKEITSSHLLAYCKKNLAPYKIPYDIFLINELPKNSVGKVDKSKLSKMLKKID